MRSREILLARLRSKLRSSFECASKAALGLENTQTQKAEGVRHFPLRKIPGLFLSQYLSFLLGGFRTCFPGGLDMFLRKISVVRDAVVRNTCSHRASRRTRRHQSVPVASFSSAFPRGCKNAKFQTVLRRSCFLAASRLRADCAG
jgi:hypothetical protein